MTGAPEIWRPIPSLPGVLASSEGRILRLPYTVIRRNGAVQHVTPKPTFGSTVSLRGRKRRMAIRFHDLGSFSVHSLVCEAFHGTRPFEGAMVLHRDEDGTNNIYTNLKWGTQKENLNAPGFIAYCKSRVGVNNPRVRARMGACGVR